MKSLKYIIVLILIAFFSSVLASNTRTVKGQEEPAIAVMYHHPELAEEYCCQLITAFAPDPETLKITYLKAQYIPLYRAYVVNCHFNTNDAYGDRQNYKIQMKVQILPNGKGEIKYNAIDFKEIR